MASTRTKRRKAQRIALKARLVRIAEHQRWWNGLTNQQKHDTDYNRYRIEVLGHPPSQVLSDAIREAFKDVGRQFMTNSPLLELLR